jgi:predicted secreted protein
MKDFQDFFFIHKMTSSLNVNLNIGEPPYIYSGWDNGGSTGYSWSVQSQNTDVIQYFRKIPDNGKNTTQLCGGGIEFNYEFHPVKPGSSEVKIFHGRPWETDENTTPKDTILFQVAKLSDEQSLELDSLIQKEQEKLNAYKDLASKNNIIISLSTTEQTTTTDTSPGSVLFRIRQELALVEPKLKMLKKHMAASDEHTILMNELRESYNQIMIESKNQENQQKLLVSKMSELTGINYAMEHVRRDAAQIKIAHPSGTSADEMKRLDELFEIKQNIQNEKEYLLKIQKIVSNLKSQVASNSGGETKK